METKSDMSPTQPGPIIRPANNLSSPMPSWLRAWWPALFWAAVIFFFSTDGFSSDRTSLIIGPIIHWFFPSLSPGGLELAHHLIRKSAHFTEYFIFCMLLYHGIRATRRDSRPWHWSWAILAWFIAAFYSALDEVHQVYVPSRGPSPWDSLLDSTGAFFALLILFVFYRRIMRLGSD